MRINIHAGHNPEGKVACGARGILDESRENRIVKNKVIQLLRAAGHDVLDCTVDDGVSQGDVLRRIVEKCNSRIADLDLSIHFNSGRNDYVGDGSIGGTEVFLYNISESNKTAIIYGKSIVEKIGDLGFRIRDDAIPDHVKTDSQLYVLRNTKAPAVLIECCFVDDKDDAELYDADKMAQAIADGVIAIAGSNGIGGYEGTYTQSDHAVSLNAPITNIEPATCAIVLTALMPAALNHFFVLTDALNTQFFT